MPRSIRATDVASFFRLVEELPPVPEGPPEGPCDMFKMKQGSRVIPVCKGKCRQVPGEKRKTCGILIRVRGEGISARCDCS